MNISLVGVAFAAFLASLLALLFGMVAFTIAATGRFSRGVSLGVAALVGLASYILTSFEGQVQWLSWSAKLLPYHYYNPPEILHGSLSWLVAAWYGVIIIMLGFIAYLFFRRRDIA
jgi:hypothetical protein